MSHSTVIACLRCGRLRRTGHKSVLVCNECRGVIQRELHQQGTVTRLQIIDHLFTQHWQQTGGVAA